MGKSMVDPGKFLEDINRFLVPKDEIKKQVTKGYIERIFREHPDINQTSVVDHLNKVMMTGANPFNNEIYFTSYFSRKLGHRVGASVFSYRWMEKIANATGEYEGMDTKVGKGTYFCPVTKEEKEDLMAEVLVYRKNRRPMKHVAWYGECVKKNNMIWNDIPHQMLLKTAKAGGLRSQFPEILTGVVVDSEMSGSDVVEVAEANYEKREEEKELIEKEKALAEKVNDLKEGRDRGAMKKLAVGEINRLTMGMEIDEKHEWLISNLKIDSISRLDDLSYDKMETLYNALKVMTKDPLVGDLPDRPSKHKRVEDVTFTLPEVDLEQPSQVTMGFMDD